MAADGEVEVDEFDKMDRAACDEYIHERLFSGKDYPLAMKRKLCRELKRWQLKPAPTLQQMQEQAASRLMEIRTVSSNLVLPASNDVDIEWSTKYTDLPEINLITIYNYFIMTPYPEVKPAELKAFKSLGSYQTAAEGSVKDIRVSIGLPDGWVYVKASVRASCRSQTWYRVWCLVNKETQRIRACRCICPAGNGEACSHAASLLFCVHILDQQGLTKALPTDVRCWWLNPMNNKQAEGGRASALRTKYDRKRRPTVRLDWVKPLHEEDVGQHRHEEDYLEVRKRKLKTDYGDGRLAKMFRDSSMDSVGDVARNEPSTSASGIEAGSDYETDMALPVRELVAKYRRAKSQSKEEANNGCELLAGIKATVTEAISECTEKSTINQGEVQEWNDLRWARITGTKAPSIVRHMRPRGGFWKQLTPTSALKQICPSAEATERMNTLPAIKWGRKYEAEAVDAYVELATKHGWHQNIKMERAGLKIPPGEGHIGASVDRIFTCSCCSGPTILEIKCPYSVRKLPPDNAAALEKLKYLDRSARSGRVMLRRNSDYFTQVQMQMGVWNISRAELFIWTPMVTRGCGYLRPLRIPFDDKYWQYLKCVIDLFYAYRVAPYLLSILGDEDHSVNLRLAE